MKHFMYQDTEQLIHVIVTFLFRQGSINLPIYKGLSFNSEKLILVDEGMPSEVALVCFFSEFCRFLR